MGISPLKFMKAKKNLGQNFLIDKNVIDTIVNTISPCNNDLIIEIGPGTGALTKELIKYDSYYMAYELDTDLKNILNKYNSNKRKIIYNDFLSTNIKDDIKNIKYNHLYIIGNLPYYITTPIIEHIIDENIEFKSLTIMIQKEVAERFLAKYSHKEYGYITVVLNYYFNIEKIIDVSKYSFNPVPKVDSTVIKLSPKEINKNIDTKEYFMFLKQCFKQKRKTLKNNIGKTYDFSKVRDILAKYNINDNVRAEELSENILLEIYKKVK